MNHASLLLLVALGILGMSGCGDIPMRQTTNAPGALSDSQQRMWQYSHAVQSGQASSLLDSPNDPPPSDQSLINQAKANYIQRGYDPKKAEQCAREDFISATGRTPTHSF